MVDDKLLGSWNGCFTLLNFCCSFLFLCFVCTCSQSCNFWCSVDGCLEAGRVWLFPKDLRRVVDCAITCADANQNDGGIEDKTSKAAIAAEQW